MPEMGCKGVFIMTNLMSHNRFPFMNYSMFNEMINDFFGKPTFWTGKEKSNYPMNVIRIIKNDEIVAYRLEFALAGFNKEDIEISVIGDVLRVATKMPKPIIDENNENEEEIIYQGISYRDLSLHYKLMDNADKKNITSKFENGLLKITIPAKVEVEGFNTIEIE